MPQTETEIPEETEDQKYFKEVDKSLVRWWDEKQVHKCLKEFISHKAAYGKAAIRIYIPKGYLVEDKTTKRTVIDVKNIDEALDKIFIEVPHFSNIIDEKDLDFGTKFTIFRPTKPKNQSPIRIVLRSVILMNRSKRCFGRWKKRGLRLRITLVLIAA